MANIGYVRWKQNRIEEKGPLSLKDFKVIYDCMNQRSTENLGVRLKSLRKKGKLNKVESAEVDSIVDIIKKRRKVK